MVKVEKSNQKINPLGGINFAINAIKQIGIPELVDNQLGKRAPQAKYSYSDLILNLWGVFFCGVMIMTTIKRGKRRKHIDWL